MAMLPLKNKVQETFCDRQQTSTGFGRIMARKSGFGATAWAPGAKNTENATNLSSLYAKYPPCDPNPPLPLSHLCGAERGDPNCLCQFDCCTSAVQSDTETDWLPWSGSWMWAGEQFTQ